MRINDLATWMNDIALVEVSSLLRFRESDRRMLCASGVIDDAVRVVDEATRRSMTQLRLIDDATPTERGVHLNGRRAVPD